MSLSAILADSSTFLVIFTGSDQGQGLARLETGRVTVPLCHCRGVYPPCARFNHRTQDHSAHFCTRLSRIRCPAGPTRHLDRPEARVPYGKDTGGEPIAGSQDDGWDECDAATVVPSILMAGSMRAKIFTRRFRVRWSETNANGQVGISGYLRYLIETARDWGAAGHLPADEVKALGQTWVVRETQIHLIRPLQYNDLFEFTIWLLEWRRVRGSRAFEIKLQDLVITHKSLLLWGRGVEQRKSA